MYGETRSGAIQGLGRGRRFGTPPQQTARRGGQWPAWWSASRHALPHNGALSLAEPQSQHVGSARQDARHHAAVRNTSTCRSQPSSWFQLAKMRLTSLRSRVTSPKRELRLGKPGEGCRAVARRAKAGSS